MANSKDVKSKVQKLKKLRGGFTADPGKNCGTGIMDVQPKKTGPAKK